LNPTKASATLALIVTLGAVGYLGYQATIIRTKYNADVRADLLAALACQAHRDAALTQWQAAQAEVQRLLEEDKVQTAADVKWHAGERPEFVGECGNFLNLTPPSYPWPTGIAVVSLIVSLALFGTVKQKRDSAR
jgi:hypothetical protein